MTDPAPPGGDPAQAGSRNAPCWCGSGKRTKACHGAIAADGRQVAALAADRRERTGGRQLIVCHAVNLLGNVLRAAASDKILADVIGAEFAVALPWRCSDSVRAAAGMLLRDYPAPGRVPALRVSETALMTFPGVYGTNSDPVQEAVFMPAAALPSGDFGVAHIYAAVPHGMATAEYVRRKVAFHASLPVAPELMAAVDGFAARHDLGRTVGFHIRHTDNLQDPLKRNLQFNTPPETFAGKLEALVESGRRVLLCSDNPAILDQMARRVPAGALVRADTLSVPALQPLYEMLLLSRTEYVVGSYASTFSYEACFFRGIDLECFERGAWRRHPIATLAAG